MTPDPRTVASIQLNAATESGEVQDFGCGCRRYVGDDSWRLCQYHEGYEDALDLESGDEHQVSTPELGVPDPPKVTS